MCVLQFFVTTVSQDVSRNAFWIVFIYIHRQIDQWEAEFKWVNTSHGRKIISISYIDRKLEMSCSKFQR